MGTLYTLDGWSLVCLSGTKRIILMKYLNIVLTALFLTSIPNSASSGSLEFLREDYSQEGVDLITQGECLDVIQMGNVLRSVKVKDRDHQTDLSIIYNGYIWGVTLVHHRWLNIRGAINCTSRQRIQFVNPDQD